MFDEFVGPRHLVYAAALEMNPLDTENRVRDLKSTHGVGYCNITKCCTKVCPENITITDNAIIPLKERVIDQLYDPVAKLLRMSSARETARGGRHGIRTENDFRRRPWPGRSRRPSATAC